MGFNSTVVVLNDHLDTIANDHDFGKKLSDAILKSGCYNEQVDVGACANNSACTGATVIETHHADNMIAVLVGGNMGQTLGYAGGYSIDVRKPESVENALRNLASKYGFNIVKKRKK